MWKSKQDQEMVMYLYIKVWHCTRSQDVKALKSFSKNIIGYSEPMLLPIQVLNNYYLYKSAQLSRFFLKCCRPSRLSWNVLSSLPLSVISPVRLEGSEPLEKRARQGIFILSSLILVPTRVVESPILENFVVNYILWNVCCLDVPDALRL